jgi:hypothetical protein
MIKTAQKYKLTFTAIRITPHLQTQLPAWYHPGAEDKPMNNPQTKYLIQNHNAHTVADMLKISA